MAQTLPTVLVIAGLDPSGGAGIQADIQTLSALQCHCTSIIATNTVQDSSKLHQSHPVATETIEQQLRTLEADFHFSAIKLGALGNTANARIVAQSIERIKANNPSIPVILDPVLKASGGGTLTDETLKRSLLDDIIPLCTLITPNEPEVKALAGDSSVLRATIKLAKLGASILITGGHQKSEENQTLENKLIIGSKQQGEDRSWIIKRVNGEFRGTGCTFSSAIAGYMANGLPMPQAVDSAQLFVSCTLENAYILASGQRVPLRNKRHTHQHKQQRNE